MKIPKCINCGYDAPDPVPCPCDDPGCDMGVCRSCAASIRRNVARSKGTSDV